MYLHETRIRMLLISGLAAVMVFGFAPAWQSQQSLVDPILRLQEKIDSGAVTMEHNPVQGYLPSLLKNLDIPVSSQSLVFSRTSLQLDRIAPWSPRAVYFNDDVYIGWVKDGPIMEVASTDPVRGTQFYSLSQEKKDKPQFQRESRTCLLCHDSTSGTGGQPGLLVRSVYPDRYGYVIPTTTSNVTTDQVPLEERWGGWYVTGKHGTQLHMGNMMANKHAHEIGNIRGYLANIDYRTTANISDLSPYFDTAPYLTPHSDVVALLVLAHQAYVHNLINVARARNLAEPLVRAMLFVKEAPMTSRMEGDSGFAAEFSARGIRDSKGRSLRDLDLERRLFRYPMSYLVYSDAFNALPEKVKRDVYTRFIEILRDGKDDTKSYTHLSEADRKAILEILMETKPDFRQMAVVR